MARGSGQTVTATRRHSWRVTGFVHVASVCSTCFKCFRRMLQVFRADVAKVDRGVQRCDMREAWKMLQSLGGCVSDVA
jgi:hypothetical protein